MSRKAPSWRQCCILAATLVWVLPARAEFYDLEGRYECLDTPDRICYDATSSLDRSPTAEPEAAALPPPPASPSAKKKVTKSAAVTPDDSLPAIGNRLQAHKPAAGDISTLVARAKSGDAKALEMLAWCSFVGVGVPRDPVRAYFLYGQAATAGAPTGRENQEMVFKRALSPDQKQQVLEIENGSRPAPK
jgi:hypothetical protein